MGCEQRTQRGKRFGKHFSVFSAFFAVDHLAGFSRYPEYTGPRDDLDMAMNPLEPPDKHYVEAAKGWCELDAFLEANEELEKISQALRAHPQVLEVRWQINANLQEWDAALEIATALTTMHPDWPSGWIYLASSLTELNRHPEAYETLSTAAERFPSDEIILYDLACVCCALKRPDEAMTWMNKAIQVGGDEIKQRALDDRDLQPLLQRIVQP